MELSLYIIDAFTEKQFQGNSAAVVPLKEWIEPALMQKIAFENNLSETAFIKEVAQNRYEIRWFSPLSEIDFCGHATLAASHVLFHEKGVEGSLTFVTQNVGELFVVQNAQDCIEMSFPNQAPTRVHDIPKALLEGLSIPPLEVWQNRQAYVAVYAHEHDIHALTYDSFKLKTLTPLDVVVTAPSQTYDFISRYFWPANGGLEDPVTGSIHAGLTPFWAERLHKQTLVAYQASQRGGVLYCTLKGDRVLVSGKGVKYLHGKIFLDV